MRPGISTASFYPKETELALQILADHHIASTEIFFNSFCELEEPFVKSLAEIARCGDVEVLSVHPFTSGFEPMLLFSNYHRRTLDGFELYKKYFNAANILGSKIVVVHGDYRGHMRDDASYFDVFGALMETGKSMGITVAHENVERCVSYTPDFFRRMAAYLPQARFVFDIKQCIRAGEAIPDMMNAMAGRICHVHISDNRGKEDDCLPIGQGTCNLQEMLHTLMVQGFSGGIVEELYRNSYVDETELFLGYDCLCKMIQCLKK